MLTGADKSNAEEVYKKFSLGYGNLNPAGADAKAVTDAMVPDAEKIAAPGVLTAKYRFNLTKDFLPYVGAGLAYSIQPEVKTGDATLRINAGVAGQAGFKYLLGGNSSLSLDYKYLNLDPDVSRVGTKGPPQSLGVGFDIKF